MPDELETACVHKTERVKRNKKYVSVRNGVAKTTVLCFPTLLLRLCLVLSQRQTGVIECQWTAGVLWSRCGCPG